MPVQSLDDGHEAALEFVFWLLQASVERHYFYIISLQTARKQIFHLILFFRGYKHISVCSSAQGKRLPGLPVSNQKTKV